MHELYNGTIRLDFQESGHRYKVSEKDGESWTTPRKVIGVSTILGVLNKPALMTWPMTEALKHIGGKLKYYNGKFIWHCDGDLVINQDLLREAAKAYTKKGDAGKDIGKEIHAGVESYLQTEKVAPHPDPIVQQAVHLFADWFTNQQAKVLGIEQVVYSKKFTYAGTFDSLLEIDGKIILCDLKTNNSSSAAPLGVYPEHFVQLGAYSLAYTEEIMSRMSVTVDPSKPFPQKATFDPPIRIPCVDDLAIIRAGKDGKMNVVFASELGLSVQDCEGGFISALNTWRFINETTRQLKERKQ